MAFAIRNLTVCAYCNGFTQWHYKASYDDITVVDSENFFADASDVFARNDVIIVCANDGVTLRYVTFASVGCVKIAPLKM